MIIRRVIINIVMTLFYSFYQYPIYISLLMFSDMKFKLFYRSRCLVYTLSYNW